ncbi:MAG: Uma2 family endonuclease [Cytophagales bacterium]|nr:MAG: Uma2 family endonuclease [Cytophagales bacterium]
MVQLETAIETLPTHFQTVDEFERWQRAHGRDGSYEFVRGRIIEKNDMKQEEFLLLRFLIRLFLQTEAHKRGDELIPEMDSYVDGVRKRRPDLAYFTLEQIEDTRTGNRQKTRFAIEILSDSESYQDVLDKVQDYFDAGAELVWYVIPGNKKINVYTSADRSQAYKGADLISAAPVLPDFQFRVDQLFA